MATRRVTLAPVKPIPACTPDAIALPTMPPGAPGNAAFRL